MTATAFHMQTVEILRKIGVNTSGEPVFAAAETIACRFERAGKIVTRRDGASAHSNAVVYTAAHIAEGDHIVYGDAEEFPVLAVTVATSLFGEFVQNEAFLGGSSNSAKSAGRSAGKSAAAWRVKG